MGAGLGVGVEAGSAPDEAAGLVGVTTGVVADASLGAASLGAGPPGAGFSVTGGISGTSTEVLGRES